MHLSIKKVLFSMTKNIFNFSAGPAMMPVEVMQQVQKEFLNWNNTGVSVAEISHRSQPFIDLTKHIEKDLRDLLSIPDRYRILFLAGGSRTQFSAIPMNLMNDYKKAAYVQTGHWGMLAAKDASRYLHAKIIANTHNVVCEYFIDGAVNTITYNITIATTKPA